MNKGSSFHSLNNINKDGKISYFEQRCDDIIHIMHMAGNHILL